MEPSDVPKQVGNYEIVVKIGEGGMGSVYKARHVKLGNYAAVKFLSPTLAEKEAFVKRFEREARLAAQLTSPYSIRTFDVGEVAGCRFILMEYVEGKNLTQVLAHGETLDEKRALSIVHDVAQALQEAHELGIVHRDMKPDNIMLTARGVPKLADLGIAKDVASGDATLTSTGAVIGTPNYMSPEQAQGLTDVDARSDIYSLGATFYRMVVGNLPFTAETPVGVMHKIATQSVPDPLAQNPELSPDVGAIICKMMAREREQRYQTMNEVIKHIGALRSGEHTGLQYDESVQLLGAKPVAPTWEREPERRRGRKIARSMGLWLGIPVLAVMGYFVVGYLVAQTTEHDLPGYGRLRGLLGDTGEADEDTSDGSKAPAGEAGGHAERDGANESPVRERLAEAIAAGKAGNWERAVRACEEALAVASNTQTQELGKSLKEMMCLAWQTTEAEKEARPVRDQMTADFRKTYEDAEDTYKDVLRRLSGLDPQELKVAKLRGIISKLNQAHGDFEKAAVSTYSYEQEIAVAIASVKDHKWDHAVQACEHALKAAMDSHHQTLAGKLGDTMEVGRQAAAARSVALRFLDKMSAGSRETCEVADKNYKEIHRSLSRLEPLELEVAQLAGIISGLTKARDEFESAVFSYVESIYPDIEKQLAAERSFAQGLFHLYRVGQDKKYGDCSFVKRLVAKYASEESIPGVTYMAFPKLLSVAKTRSKDYPSRKDAAKAREAVDEALALCDRLERDNADAGKVRRLRYVAFSRRAAAQDAEGKPMAALADACRALSLGGAEGDIMTVLDDAAARWMEDLGRALASENGDTAELLRRTGSELLGDVFMPAHQRLSAALAAADFSGQILRDPLLVSAWRRNLGPFVTDGMIRIPAGKFLLGQDHSGLASLTPSHAPQHPVAIEECYIDVHEVTNEEFQRFVDDGGYADPRYWAEAKAVDPGKFTDATGKPGPRFWRNGRFPRESAKLPVAGVSWYEAAAYARWTGKRLPTEAEWECAALGVPPAAKENTFKRSGFPWDKHYVMLMGVANLRKEGLGVSGEVGSWTNDKSPLGCCDIIGNVSEWTCSEYAPYLGTKCADKRFGQGMISLRGASFADSSVLAKPWLRRAYDKKTRNARIGFRCAWSPRRKGPGG